MDESGSQVFASGAAQVSVVVPSFNHAEFVATTLRSIMKQTWPPAQLLVIDDGSTDHSPRVIEHTLKESPFASELIVTANRGLSRTLNDGLARTSGAYFAYLGSDDVWLPDFLKDRVFQLQSRKSAVLAYGHAYFIDAQNHIIDSTADWAHYTDGDPREMLLRTIAPMSPTVMYRRSALEKEAWNEMAKLEDYDLYLRLSGRGEFAFNPRILSAWRQHQRNTSRDQMFMLKEQLAAQRAVLPTLGLTEPQLNRLQRSTQFHRAEDFMRIGDKRTAIELMMQNASSARSPKALARMLVRLAVPASVMRRRKKSKQRNATERFGSIDV